MYIAVAGNIGAGKSTLVKLLSKAYALQPVYEAVDENPYLEDFYQDMPSYAFKSQIFFLAKRLEQHLGQVNNGDRLIQDRTIYEDAAIFAQNLFDEGLMDERDFASYKRMYEAIRLALRPPDLLIYVQASVETLKARIALRGRDYEQAIAETYLKRLNVLYERFIAGYDSSDVLIVSADQTDFIHNPADLPRLKNRLEQFGLVPPIL
ncbi:MAG: deoxynucleoside kinase [Trueperaceae bacterium]|nr:deoxynucleoside kinase [Trueperaceae bacterium]